MTSRSAVPAALLAALTLLVAPARAETSGPLAAGAAAKAGVIEGIELFVDWRLDHQPFAFGRTELRRVGDFSHLRAVVTRGDGSPIDPESIRDAGPPAVPVTLSAVLQRRGDRWLLLDADVERDDPKIDPDARFRLWRLPAGLLPPGCEHRQNWGCGSATPR